MVSGADGDSGGGTGDTGGDASDLADGPQVHGAMKPASAESKNAHGNESAKISGHFGSKQLGKSGNAHAKNSGQIRGHFPATSSTGNELQGNAHKKSAEMPTDLPTEKSVNISGNAHGNEPGKISGHFGTKSVGKSGNAHRSESARTEWFRYEMDFRDRKKGGYQVLIRRRLKWSETRYAPQVRSCYCADLTEKMVNSIKDGKFTRAAITALERGGIGHEIIKSLVERIGKGNGKRAAELTDHERSILARIESGLAAGGGRRNAPAGGTGRDLGLPNLNVPDARDGEFTEVPNVH